MIGVRADGTPLRDDPPVRDDGRCFVCGKRRTLTVNRKSGANKQHRELLEGELQADPFCSATCCRKHHECELARTHLDVDDDAAAAA